jgi:hypothetical protein
MEFERNRFPGSKESRRLSLERRENSDSSELKVAFSRLTSSEEGQQDELGELC